MLPKHSQTNTARMGFACQNKGKWKPGQKMQTIIHLQKGTIYLKYDLSEENVKIIHRQSPFPTHL